MTTTVVDLSNTLGVLEAAKRIHRHPETVKRLIRQGELPAQKVGQVWFIDIADLDALMSRDGS